MLAELLLRADAHGEAEGGGRVGVDPGRELVGVLAARLGERGDRVDDVRGLVRPTADRLRRQVGAVRLGEDPVGGDGGRRLAQRLGLRIRRVAGEGEVPAALDACREQLRLREAVHDDGAVVRAQHRLGVGVRGAGVDDDRQTELRGERELRREEAALLVLRVAAVVVVEPGLADRDRLRVVEQGAELADALRLGRRGLMRVDPERRVDAVVRASGRARDGTSRSPSRS